MSDLPKISIGWKIMKKSEFQVNSWQMLISDARDQIPITFQEILSGWAPDPPNLAEWRIYHVDSWAMFILRHYVNRNRLNDYYYHSWRHKNIHNWTLAATKNYLGISISPKSSTELVIVHLRFTLPGTPQSGNFIRVFDDKLSIVSLPSDDFVVFFFPQQLQDEVPQLDLSGAWTWLRLVGPFGEDKPWKRAANRECEIQSDRQWDEGEFKTELGFISAL